MIDCKFVDLAGNVLGRRLIPEDVGVVVHDQKYFAKMVNGDADHDQFPFVFVQTGRLVVGMLEKINSGKRKSRRVPEHDKPARTGHRDDRRGGRVRKRSNQP